MNNCLSFQTSFVVKHKSDAMASGCYTKSLLFSFWTLEFFACRIIFEILGLCFHASGRGYWKWQVQVMDFGSESGLGEMQSSWRNAKFLRSPAVFDLQGRASEKQLNMEVLSALLSLGASYQFQKKQLLSTPTEKSIHVQRLAIDLHACIFCPLKLKRGGKKYNRNFLLITGKCIENTSKFVKYGYTNTWDVF